MRGKEDAVDAQVPQDLDDSVRARLCLGAAYATGGVSAFSMIFLAPYSSDLVRALPACEQLFWLWVAGVISVLPLVGCGVLLIFYAMRVLKHAQLPPPRSWVWSAGGVNVRVGAPALRAGYAIYSAGCLFVLAAVGLAVESGPASHPVESMCLTKAVPSASRAEPALMQQLNRRTASE